MSPTKRYNGLRRRKIMKQKQTWKLPKDILTNYIKKINTKIHEKLCNRAQLIHTFKFLSSLIFVYQTIFFLIFHIVLSFILLVACHGKKKHYQLLAKI